MYGLSTGMAALAISPEVTSSSDTMVSSPATDWSEEEVQEWLRKKNLRCPTLEGFDGAALHELYIDLQDDAKAFKEELKTGFEMESSTAYRFTAQLRKLFAE